MLTSIKPAFGAPGGKSGEVAVTEFAAVWVTVPKRLTVPVPAPAPEHKTPPVSLCKKQPFRVPPLIAKLAFE